MVVCFLCKSEFKDNLGGQLTNHLKKSHDISMEDYVVITELDNKEPRCMCGFCDERPSFYRGKFKRFKSGHDDFEFRKSEYLKKFGSPYCKTCRKEVKFFRGKPNTYCDSGCRPSCWNQPKINETVKDRYDVDNVMEIKEFRDKISVKNKELWENNYDDQLDKIKKTNLDRFGVEFAPQNTEVKEKQMLTLLKNYGVTHYSKTEKFRSDSSRRMCENNPAGNWNNFSHKKYKSTDLPYQSSYEYDFLEFCESNNILHLIKKSPSFRYLNKKSYHFPDYLYNDTIIEIKSTWILDLQGGPSLIQEKIKSVESLGYKYLLILDKDYLQFEKSLNQ